MARDVSAYALLTPATSAGPTVSFATAAQEESAMNPTARPASKKNLIGPTVLVLGALLVLILIRVELDGARMS